MRLFVGLDLPDEVVHNLDGLLERLRPKARIQWSPPANLHITTTFIGAWEESRLDELKMALGEVPSRPVIAVQVHRLGFFPNPHSPRVLFGGIEAAGLHDLAKDTDRVAAALGIEREKREYSPHLTLARIREKVDLQPLREAIASLPSTDFGSFPADRFFLYQSTPTQGGSVYTKLAEFPLSK